MENEISVELEQNDRDEATFIKSFFKNSTSLFIPKSFVYIIFGLPSFTKDKSCMYPSSKINFSSVILFQILPQEFHF